MKLYHGSNIEVRKPEIRPSKFTKDFGVGFYCTRLKRQAKRWACRKTPSVISEYEFIRKSELSVKVFSNMTDEWLDFIVSCRRGYTHNYDIVIGPMANDQVYNYVEDFGVPTYWDIGKVYKRLIVKVSEGNARKFIPTLKAVYNSWIADYIDNYNTSFYYDSSDCHYKSYLYGDDVG